MSTLELPVRSDLPAFEFTIDLEERLYTLSFRFNERKQLWSMDIKDSEGADILMGIVLLTDVNITDQYANISSEMPPGRFFVVDQTGERKNAGINDLGNDVKVFYLTSDEATAVS